MSMKSIISLTLTQEELEALKRQTDRLYLHKTRTSPREVRRKEEDYKLLRALMNKIGTLPEGVLELNLRRKELRVIEAICVSSISLLTNGIIVGYASRESKEQDPVQKQKYAQYRSRAEKALDLMVKLNNKVQGAL